MSGIALATGTAVSAPAAARKSGEVTGDNELGTNDLEAQDITIGDSIRATNNEPARVYNTTSFTSNIVDRVPRSTGGTVNSVADGTWYGINWNLGRNVANGYTPQVDIYEY